MAHSFDPVVYLVDALSDADRAPRSRASAAVCAADADHLRMGARREVMEQGGALSITHSGGMRSSRSRSLAYAGIVAPYEGGPPWH